MAASEHLNPAQLKLFMSGTEFKEASYKSIDFGRKGEDDWDRGWNKKLEEAKLPAGTKEAGGFSAHGAGVYDSILEHGYDPARHDIFDEGLPGPSLILGKEPDQFIQGEGHHRIAAAADIEEKTGRKIWMPVNYEDDPYFHTKSYERR